MSVALLPVDIGQQPYAQIYAFLGQRHLHRGSVHIDQINLDLRIAALETAKQIGQKITQHGVGGRQPYGALGRLRQERGMAHGVVDRIHDMAGMMKKTLRSEEHTSELQSLMRNSYAVFCLKKKKNTQQQQ